MDDAEDLDDMNRKDLLQFAKENSIKVPKKFRGGPVKKLRKFVAYQVDNMDEEDDMDFPDFTENEKELMRQLNKEPGDVAQSTVHNELTYICNCGNIDMGFNCVCSWVKANPGIVTFTCEFCGIYEA